MKAVIVHRGARDAYQAALALAERGRLECLVTDFYWPADRWWAHAIEKLLPARAIRALRLRWASGIASGKVKCCWLSGLVSFSLDRLPGAPFRLRQQATRWADRSLGEAAGKLAKRKQAALLSYSYYGSSAFASAGPSTPRLLFQLHPHPVSVRRILERELHQHPDCAGSLKKEWELALPEQDFKRLANEAALAQHWIAASSFTRATLAQNGIDPSRIHVVPYGVDSRHFRPPSQRKLDRSRPLRLLFVGTINQRKGIKYLLQALELLPGLPLEVTVCGRPVDDLALFRQFADRVRIRPSVSASELLECYQEAELFVFPSVAEGFGQVLLEAMASGLPVLSTTHTAAPDLIREGIEGFVVEPRRPDLLANRIAWADLHRAELQQMGSQARLRAEWFTQARFRAGLAECVARALAPALSEEATQYV